MVRASVTAFTALLSLAVTFLSADGAAIRGSVSLSALAPADEYFGRLKLSPFGIRHKVFSLKDDLHHARARPDAIEHDAELVEDALRDWTARFPHDPWIAATAWNLATLYEELPGPGAQGRAVNALQFVRDRFATSVYAHYAARDLSRGVGVRPWPRWATPAATPTAATPTAAAPSAATPSAAPTPYDAATLVAAVLAQHDLPAAITLETKFRALSKNGADPQYARAAWELAVLYQRLPGEEARQHAIRMLALLVDRYPGVIFGRWALRDLERGVGVR
jgi:hypothetical protein